MSLEGLESGVWGEQVMPEGGEVRVWEDASKKLESPFDGKVEGIHDVIFRAVACVDWLVVKWLRAKQMRSSW